MVSLGGAEVKDTAEGGHREGKVGVLGSWRPKGGRTVRNSLSQGPTFPFFELQHAMSKSLYTIKREH